MLRSNFRTNVLEAIRKTWKYLVSHFLRFLEVDYRSSRLHGLFMFVLKSSFSFSLVWSWLLPLLFWWRRSLQVSHKFYISLYCSLSSCTCFSIIAVSIMLAPLFSSFCCDVSHHKIFVMIRLWRTIATTRLSGQSDLDPVFDLSLKKSGCSDLADLRRIISAPLSTIIVRLSLKQRMRNPAESNKSAYGIDKHIRIAKTDKTQRSACSVEWRRNSQALCLSGIQRLRDFTIKRVQVLRTGSSVPFSEFGSVLAIARLPSILGSNCIRERPSF